MASSGLAGIPGTLLRRSPFFLLITVCILMFIDLVNLSATIIALPSIQSEFKVSVGQLQWVISSCALAFGSFLFIGYRLGGYYSQRSLLLIGLTTFALFNLVAALVPNFIGLVVARALQGIGAALTVPASQALIRIHFQDPKERARALWLLSVTGSIGSCAGFVIGGALTEHLSWRWIFWISLIGSGTLLPVFILTVPHRLAEQIGSKELPSTTRTDSPNNTHIVTSLLATLDIVGLVVLLASTFMFIYALTSSQDNGWSSAKVVAPLVVSVALMAFLSFHETRIEHPLVPVELMFNLSFDLNLLTATLSYAIRQACTFFLALELQYDGSSPLEAGVKFLPMGIAALLFNALSGWITPVVGYKILYTVGWALVVVGTVLFSFLSKTSSFWSSTFVGEILWSLGLGATYTMASYVAVATVPRDQYNLAASAFSSALQVGGTVLGLGVFTALGLGIDRQHGTPTLDGRPSRVAFQSVYYSCAILSFIGLVVAALFITIPRTTPAEPAALSQVITEKTASGQPKKFNKGDIQHTTHDRLVNQGSLEDMKAPLTTRACPPGMVEAAVQTGKSLVGTRAQSVAGSDNDPLSPDAISLHSPAVFMAVRPGHPNLLHSKGSYFPPQPLNLAVQQTRHVSSSDQSSERTIKIHMDTISPFEVEYTVDTPGTGPGPTPPAKDTPYLKRTFADDARDHPMPENASRIGRPPTHIAQLAVPPFQRSGSALRPEHKNSFARNSRGDISPKTVAAELDGSTTAVRDSNTAVTGTASHAAPNSSTRHAIFRPNTLLKPQPSPSHDAALGNSYATVLGSYDYVVSPASPKALPQTPLSTKRPTTPATATHSANAARARSRSNGRRDPTASRTSWYTDQSPMPGLGSPSTAMEYYSSADNPSTADYAIPETEYRAGDLGGLGLMPLQLPRKAVHPAYRSAGAEEEAVAERVRELGPQQKGGQQRYIVDKDGKGYVTGRDLRSSGTRAGGELRPGSAKSISSRRTSWSTWRESWVPTKTPRLDMSFDFDGTPFEVGVGTVRF